LWLLRDPAEVRIVRRFTGSLQKGSCANIAKSRRRVNVLKLLGKAEPADAARFKVGAEALRNRDCLMCILAPVRNFFGVCFE